MQMINLSTIIIKYHEESAPFTPVGKMDRLAYDNNFNYTLINIFGPYVIIRMTFEDYEYAFAVENDWSDIS